MTDVCTVNFLAAVQWLVGIYLFIGFSFALAGLGINLATCKQKHDFLHVFSHIQATIIDVLIWPMKIGVIVKIYKSKDGVTK